MARPHALADPEFAHDVAVAFVAGMTREEMCDMFGVRDPKTITRWRRDVRVTSVARKLIQDRVLEVTRKVDGVISQRLQTPENLTIKDLLDIRKEFLGGQLRDQTQEIDEETVNEAARLSEEDPDAFRKIQEMLKGGAKGARLATPEDA